jgi:hypothetical protein
MSAVRNISGAFDPLLPLRVRFVNTCQKNNPYFKTRFKISLCPSNRCTIDGSEMHATCSMQISFYSNSSYLIENTLCHNYEDKLWCSLLMSARLVTDSSLILAAIKTCRQIFQKINYSPLKSFRWESLWYGRTDGHKTKHTVAYRNCLWSYPTNKCHF